MVPANPEKWDRDPFKLFIEGDDLYGRGTTVSSVFYITLLPLLLLFWCFTTGTTDCLGHVALLTDFMIKLAEEKPKLKVRKNT